MTAENDSAELEALFDSIVAESAPAPAAVPPLAEAAPAPADMYSRIGQLTRQLYDTLRQLGYDGALQKVAQKDIPDARERLAYIAEMSEQAATKTLNAVERIQPLQDALENEAKKLSQRWHQLYHNRLNVEEFKQLAGDTHQFVQEIPARTRKSNALLMEIMMAQDFQDLTGQVIKKVVAMAQKMEQEMLQLLVAALPAEKRAEIDAGLLDGPVINPTGRDDVATSQAQVDELLESLGF